jgi:broad specificity phosphatase PhoE
MQTGGVVRRVSPLVHGGPDVDLMTGAALSTTRRAVLLTIIAIVTLAMSTVLAGCATSTTPPPDAAACGVAPSARSSPVVLAPEGVAPGTMVMVIRHGEKPDDSSSGIDAEGKADDSSLTEIGWDRAHRLVELLDPTQGAPRQGLARPAVIYAAGPNDNGMGKRTRETTKPLADRLGIPVNASYGKDDEEALVEHVSVQPGPTLISWQHGEIPAIAEAFPSVTPTPPSEWPDDRFDVIWTLTKTADGWHFAQLPELVLLQDQVSVIED